VRTYTENVYSHFAASGDLTAVVPHALPLILFTVALLLLAATTWPKGGNERQPEEPYCWSLGKWQGTISGVVLLFVVWLVFVPVINLVVQAGMKVTLQNGQPTRVWSFEKLIEILRLVPSKFAPEFLSTAELASAAMFVSVIVGGWLAWFAQRSRWTACSTWLISLLGLATPAPLLGVAVIWLLNQPHIPFFIYLYDRTIVPPLLAIVIRTGALSFLLFERAWRSLDPDLIAAVELEGASRWQVFRLIALPQRWGTVLAVSVITFAVAAGDLAASLLTLPPGFFTVSQRMFGLVHSGVDDQVAGLGLWCWCGFLCAAWLLNRTRWWQLRG
jgi:ABC-type Fe3+ transport system permease subunit